jgi:hypothetical protein
MMDLGAGYPGHGLLAFGNGLGMGLKFSEYLRVNLNIYMKL